MFQHDIKKNGVVAPAVPGAVCKLDKIVPYVVQRGKCSANASVLGTLAQGIKACDKKPYDRNAKNPSEKHMPVVWACSHKA